MPDEDTKDNELCDREDKVYADATYHVVEARELIDAGENWGKVFDLIP